MLKFEYQSLIVLQSTDLVLNSTETLEERFKWVRKQGVSAFKLEAQQEIQKADLVLFINGPDTILIKSRHF